MSGKEKKEYGINTGLRIQKRQMARLNELCELLGLSRNATIGLLIDSAEPISKPVVRVRFTLPENNGDEHE